MGAIANFAQRLTGAATGARAMPRHLDIDGRLVPVEVREHPGARRLVMRLSPCGRAIRLTVPRRASARAVADFLHRHRRWAAERLALREKGPRVAVGAKLPFRGEPLLLCHEPGRRQARFAPAEPGASARLIVGGEAAHLARRVRDVFFREARADLEAAVARHAAAAGVVPAALAIKDTTSRWGSCSQARRLSFSFRLVMAPPFVLDYLAAPGVAHLREMNHGPAFWTLCRTLCPRTDEARLWLKANAGALHAVRFD